MIDLPFLSATNASFSSAKLFFDSCVDLGCYKSTIKIAKPINDNTNATVTPILIIRPKPITG